MSLDSLCIWHVHEPVYCDRRIHANLFNPVADIENPDLFACGCRTWICFDIARFYEEQCQSSSKSALPKKR